MLGAQKKLRFMRSLFPWPTIPLAPAARARHGNARPRGRNKAGRLPGHAAYQVVGPGSHMTSTLYSRDRRSIANSGKARRRKLTAWEIGWISEAT